jgi:hypothetical protein
METAKQYRERADECLAWAKETKSDRHRELFLKMAEDWLRAASIFDRSDLQRKAVEARSHESETQHSA